MITISKLLRKKRQLLPLKILTVLLLFVCFSQVRGQQNNQSPAETVKEKQAKTEKKLSAGEKEALRKKSIMRQKELEKNGVDTRNTIPALSTLSTGDCPGDFENGTVSPWTGYTATNDELIGLSGFLTGGSFTTGTVSGRHTVVSGGFDGIVPTLPRVKSGNNSLKLGNENAGSEVDRVAITVTATGSCVTFWYALVFDRPDDHDENDMPFFIAKVEDASGNVIGSFVKSSSLDLSYFTKLDPEGVRVYRDWTKHTIDLGCDYINQTVTIEFTVSDCSRQAHFGYAYIDDVCFEDCCCNTCEELINLPDLYTTYPLIVYNGSTHSTCCYKLNFPFGIADVFKCGVYGIRIYEEGNPGNPVSAYQDDIDVDHIGFDQTQLDFCIAKAGFTTPKTFVIALYDVAGNLICDEIKRTIEPCYSQSGCNCDNMFANPEFAGVPVITKDPNNGNEDNCCFIFNPFRDEGIVKCPYYGVRVYKDGNAGSAGWVYVDVLNEDPLGGPGAEYSPGDYFKFCVSKKDLGTGMTLRIEYLDEEGKVICTKTQDVTCDKPCCDDVTVGISYFSSAEYPNKCCFHIGGGIDKCSNITKVELWEETGTGWVMAGSVAPSGNSYSFGSFCREKGEKIRFMILFKDELWRTTCHKELEAYCKDCCKDIVVNWVYRGSNAEHNYINCCWDIFAIAPQGTDCPYHFPMLYEEYEIPAQHVNIIPVSWNGYLGMHCTESYLNPAIYLPPGGSTTITKTIKKILAVYDQNGDLVCSKLIENSCTRTFTMQGGGIGFEGLTVAPNPFDNTFSLQMNLQEAMAIEAKVIDGKGEEVWKHNYGEQPAGIFSRDIDLKGLPSGLYILSVNNGMATVQIVKQ